MTHAHDPESHLVYAVSVEILATEGSQMWGLAKGGFLICLVTAKDAEQAIIRSKKALYEDRYVIKSVDEVVRYDNFEWDPQDSSLDFDELRDEAVSTNDVVYSEIFTYAEEDDDSD